MVNYLFPPQISNLSFIRVRHRLIAWFFIFLTGVFTYSCTYFRVKDADVPGLQKSIEKSQVVQSFVIHSGGNSYILDDIKLTSEEISGNIKASGDSSYYYTEGRKYKYRAFEKTIIHEVHIYLKKSDLIELGEGSIPLSSIEEIRIINPDVGKSIAAFVGTLLGIYLLLVIIILLTKSSCPYIYSHDGEGFVFEGELYGGAFAKNLERDDYMALPSIKPVNNEYRIRISNELKENQYTDLAHLLVVEHSPKSRVLPDQQGELHLIEESFPPKSVKTRGDRDVTKILKEVDQSFYEFNDPEFAVNSLELEFERDINKDQCNLVINAKNTLWFDYQFGQFLEKFGGTFNSWMAKQAELPTEERIQKGRERFIPLAIYLKQNNQWELVEYVNTVGPMAYRDLLVPIDLSGVDGDKLQIKIETGFNFWEIDQVGLSYTESAGLNVTRLKPVVSKDLKEGVNPLLLRKPDGEYLTQTKGDIAELRYKIPKTMEGQKLSVFLHTKGYYELVRDYSGPPELTELMKYKNPTWMAEYSRLQYISTLNNKNEIAFISKP